MLRKTLLIRGQPRTDPMMNGREAKLLHLVHCFVRRPALRRHAIGRNHHAGAVIAETAMHEHSLFRIFLQQLQESYVNIVVRERTMPRDGDILHPQAAHLFSLAVRPVATGVHDNVDPHFRQRFEPFMGWLRTAKKGRRNFAEIAYALDFPLLADCACRMRSGAPSFLLRFFPGAHRDRQQQRDVEHAKAAKRSGHRKRYTYLKSYGKRGALPDKTKRPGSPGLLSFEMEFVYRVTGAAFRSAMTRRALSASARACGNNSSALTTSGSVSARTFRPSSCPKESMKSSALMFERSQSLFSISSASVNAIFSASRNLRKSCSTASSTSKFWVTLCPR